jgi:hypothetical protein
MRRRAECSYATQERRLATGDTHANFSAACTLGVVVLARLA